MVSKNFTLNQDATPGARFLLTVACLVIVVAGIKLAAPILIPIALGCFLSILSLPLVFWLKKKSVPSPLAILVAVLVDAAVVVVLLLLITTAIYNFQSRIGDYEQPLDELTKSSIEWLQDTGFPVTNYLSEEILESITFKDAISAQGIVQAIDPSAIFGVAHGAFAQVIALLSKTFFVSLIVIFLLAEAITFPDKLTFIFGKDSKVLPRFRTITQEIFQYLLIKTLASATTGILVGLGCWIIGLDFAILWGLIAFGLNYIPTIGSIVASIPAILLAIIQLGPGHALATLALYICINIFIGNFIEPMFLGKRLGLSTLVVVLSLVIWGWIWGPMGMLLSIPLTMILKIAMLNTPDFRWIATLISRWPVEKEHIEAKVRHSPLDAQTIQRVLRKPNTSR
ncbi:MAG: AI-2E family transporter [Verrucomicrobiota bacterium]